MILQLFKGERVEVRWGSLLQRFRKENFCVRMELCPHCSQFHAKRMAILTRAPRVARSAAICWTKVATTVMVICPPDKCPRGKLSTVGMITYAIGGESTRGTLSGQNEVSAAVLCALADLAADSPQKSCLRPTDNQNSSSDEGLSGRGRHEGRPVWPRSALPGSTRGRTPRSSQRRRTSSRE